MSDIKFRATPVARFLSKQNNIDLSLLKGTGPKEMCIRDRDNDFEKLKVLFTTWMKERVEFILNNKDDIRARSILMDNQKTFPITTEDYICAYTGVISLFEFEKLNEEGIDAVCERLFLFNEKDVYKRQTLHYLR